VFKLVTGSPGDGKTSNELWDFLHAPEYNGRPKFCTPVNGFTAADHGVTEIEHIKIWQDLPDGSVIFVDEVQDYLGARSSREPPDWIQQLARHRHRGFDFIVTTQSPLFLDQFVRKLAKPHVHYIRPWNMKGARYVWDTVQNDPTTKSAKALGQRSLVTPNKEVFKLYQSTVLDTHKAKPPLKLILTGVGALVFLVGALYVAISTLGSIGKPAADPASVTFVDEAHSPLNALSPAAITSEVVDTKVWSVDTLKPRIEGLEWSAPVYDGLTSPSDFPRVAACFFSQRKGCECFTQQATPVKVPESACLVFVSDGSFDPWLSKRKSTGLDQAPTEKTPPLVLSSAG
jgi:zona occludens toxin